MGAMPRPAQKSAFCSRTAAADLSRRAMKSAPMPPFRDGHQFQALADDR
jgi:hypothetical protein